MSAAISPEKKPRVSQPAQQRIGSMLLISGPSGSGKSTICKQLLMSDDVVFSVSATTRTPRPGEVDGQHYHFLSP
ncbi:MAG: guanylate kinase, partial [Paracoccaceae bacterium]